MIAIFAFTFSAETQSTVFSAFSVGCLAAITFILGTNISNAKSAVHPAWRDVRQFGQCYHKINFLIRITSAFTLDSQCIRCESSLWNALLAQSSQWASLTVARRFKLTPASAASSVSSRCTSGGTRTMNLPLNRRLANASGMGSFERVISVTTSATTLRMPRSEASGERASQDRLGNSAQSPTYS